MARGVILVHYHLRPGGVTTVLLQQYRLLLKQGHSVLILVGEKPAAIYNLPVNHYTVVPALSYNNISANLIVDDCVQKLLQIASSFFVEKAVVWHIHNPTLGKNPYYPVIIKQLALRQQHIVSHIHDFYEDGRKQNKINILDVDALYPQAPQINYIVINRRDYRYLLSAGCEQVYYLPNMIPKAVSKIKKDNTNRKNYRIFYPVRTVLRKNLGEFFLLSLIGKDFATWIYPSNAVGSSNQLCEHFWQSFLQKWQSLVSYFDNFHAKEWNREQWFQKEYQRADFIVTTSIQEGFGLAFIEPWVKKKALFGRKIATLSEDLSELGIDLSTLYDALLIPIRWVVVPDKNLISYDYQNEKYYDFGMLSLPQQASIIDSIYRDETKANLCYAAWLSKKYSQKVTVVIAISIYLKQQLSCPNQNFRHVVPQVVQTLGEDSYYKKLIHIYNTCFHSKPAIDLNFIDSKHIRKSFLLGEKQLPDYGVQAIENGSISKGLSINSIDWSRVKLVAFDIYGTCLSHRRIATISKKQYADCIKKLWRLFAVNISSQKASLWQSCLQQVISDYHAKILKKYPDCLQAEVNITAVWQTVCQILDIRLPSNKKLADIIIWHHWFIEQPRLIAGVYDYLIQLQQRGIHLAIVSNAQHYTPKVLQHYLGDFYQRYLHQNAFYSYQYQRAKPDKTMFNELIKQSQLKKIYPSEIVYIGNDWYSDIMVAKELNIQPIFYQGIEELTKKPRQLKELEQVVNISNWQQLL